MKKTVLFDKHIKLGAKIVDFAGFKLPISYSSVTEEHNHVRENVGVFDVSHMGEFEISGKNSDKFIQFICSNDIMKLKPGKAQYNCLVNDNGGIIDDLIVYKIEEEKFLLVVHRISIQILFKVASESLVPKSTIRIRSKVLKVVLNRHGIMLKRLMKWILRISKLKLAVSYYQKTSVVSSMPLEE